MSPTRPDGAGLTNREQKIVRAFEVAAILRDGDVTFDDVTRKHMDTAYEKARKDLVALIRGGRRQTGPARAPNVRVGAGRPKPK